MAKAKCVDCGRKYGNQYGFPDLIVPDDVWLRISPKGDFGGLLCPSCICKRVHDAGLKEVEARFMSGPFASRYKHSWTPRPGDTLAPRRHRDELEEKRYESIWEWQKDHCGCVGCCICVLPDYLAKLEGK